MGKVGSAGGLLAMFGLLGVLACSEPGADATFANLLEPLRSADPQQVGEALHSLEPVGHLLLRYQDACQSYAAADSSVTPVEEIRKRSLRAFRMQMEDLAPLRQPTIKDAAVRTKAIRACAELLAARQLLAGAAADLDGLFARFPLTPGSDPQIVARLQSDALFLLAAVRGLASVERLRHVIFAGAEISTAAQQTAVKLLGELRAEDAREDLVRLSLLREPPPTADGPAPQPPPVSCSADRFQIWRGLAVTALGQLSDRQVLQPLLDALADPCLAVRRLAAESLRNVNSRWKQKAQ